MTLLRDLFMDVVDAAGVRVLARSGEPLARLATVRVQSDPYQFYASLPPVVRGRHVAGVVVTSYELVRTVLRDERFGVDDGTSPELEDADAPPRDDEMLLRMDPPAHTRLRGIVAGELSARSFELRRPAIEAVVGRLIDAVIASGRMDAVADLAAPLAGATVCDLLGVPYEHREQLLLSAADAALAMAIAAPRSRRRRAAEGRAWLSAYMNALVAESSVQPAPGVVAALLRTDERLAVREVRATCVLVMLAGLQTVTDVVGNGVAALAANPDQAGAFLTDAEACLHELLRYESPVQITNRVALADTELAGVPVGGGETVAAVIGAANNDPAVFDDPRRLDLSRENAAQHLAFSSGAHYCLGAPLARIAGEVAFRAVAERLPNLRLAGRAVRRPGAILRGFLSLPVAFDPG